ncbi:hypothetical protein V6N13_106870 [Hibiscus sabdariffa]|uniref:Uncharacterized protein n=1 Tax=Hibiscus sabdariffa TaxID=183260 RepID=A0ABR2F201_9ROSI
MDRSHVVLFSFIPVQESVVPIEEPIVTDQDNILASNPKPAMCDLPIVAPQIFVPDVISFTTPVAEVPFAYGVVNLIDTNTGVSSKSI